MASGSFHFHLDHDQGEREHTEEEVSIAIGGVSHLLKVFVSSNLQSTDVARERVAAWTGDLVAL